MDDYYDIVGVDRSASRDTIDRALRDQLRSWQQRTASAGLARRQAAERRVRQLAAARDTLLDAQKRRRYDGELAALGSPVPPEPPEPPEPPVAPVPPERGRFDTLPEPIPPAAWVEEAGADSRYEPPENRLGSAYGLDS